MGREGAYGVPFKPDLPISVKSSPPVPVPGLFIQTVPGRVSSQHLPPTLLPSVGDRQLVVRFTLLILFTPRRLLLLPQFSALPPLPPHRGTPWFAHLLRRARAHALLPARQTSARVALSAGAAARLWRAAAADSKPFLPHLPPHPHPAHTTHTQLPAPPIRHCLIYPVPGDLAPRDYHPRLPLRQALFLTTSRAGCAVPRSARGWRRRAHALDLAGAPVRVVLG